MSSEFAKNEGLAVSRMRLMIRRLALQNLKSATSQALSPGHPVTYKCSAGSQRAAQFSPAMSPAALTC